MTLSEIISKIERTAMNQPSVNTIVGNDIFRLNQIGTARYGVFAWSQETHRFVTSNGQMRFNFDFFYVDRLTNSQDNMVEVQSVGIQTLQNFLLKLEDSDIDVEMAEFTPFNQRFTDECAGIRARVVLVTTASLVCGETYEYADNYGGLLTAEGWQVIDVLGAKILVRQDI